ncbi:MAG: hypothetical protein KDK36_21710 [Leptospiraceae bacterium]|nr:hypothetical protein [Leptospiraceae bacterium]
MNTLEYTLLFSIPGIFTLITSIKMIIDINSDRSSTAAIGYFAVPFIAIGIFLISLAAMFAIISLIQVFRGIINLSSIKAIISIIIIIVFAFSSFWYFSLPSLKEDVTIEQQEEIYFKYKNNSPAFFFIEERLLSQKDLSQKVLVDFIKTGNYEATRHENLSGETILELSKSALNLESGILGNLAAHKNITVDALKELSKPRVSDFKNKDDWDYYKQLVFPNIESNEKTPESVKKEIRSFIEK